MRSVPTLRENKSALIDNYGMSAIENECGPEKGLVSAEGIESSSY